MIRLNKGTVLPEWIDYNGHMNIAYYTIAFDIAMDEFFGSHFGMDIDYVDRHKVGPFALQIDYCYLSELHEGEHFDVFGRILDFDHKRMHLFQQMQKSSDGSLVATCESLSMNVDHVSRKSAAYSHSILADIKRIHELNANEPIPPQVGQKIGIRK